ncbi:MAG: hypothetical protein AMK73_08455 [Planctomycetes bacterium SM23_32]|nr:MAG: hypothetical protein AMK73_08455 [Planctomycetes bacterium SM23_32]
MADAVESAFPAAVITGVELEDEEGAMLYVVRMERGERTLDVELSPEGVIGEIEIELGLDDVPQYMAEAIRQATGGGEIALIEMHELRGRVQDGELVALDEPMVVYEVGFIVDNRRHLVEVADEPALELPQPARAAIRDAFPEAIVKQVEAEREMGLTLYEVELVQNGQEVEVEVSADGVIAEVQVSVKAEELPPAVADAILRAADGAKVPELEKVEIRATPELATLDEPQVVYEAEFSRDGKEYEIRIASDGTVIELKEEQGEDHDDEAD